MVEEFGGAGEEHGWLRSPMDPNRIYEYLTRSRRPVFDAIQSLTPGQYLHPFTFGLLTIGSTITHIMISEWYYVERLVGRPVAPYQEWPIKYETPPTFEIVAAGWIKQAETTRGAIAAERDWARKISYEVTSPDPGTKRIHVMATAGDIVTQLALHEVHHRAQVMAMIRELGVRPVEDIDYNAMMYERREMP
jgi:uncharacterized damage-inducible protein DinB